MQRSDGRSVILGPDSVIRRGTAHVESDLDDQTVMFSLDRETYFAVCGTARRIWALIGEPIRFDALVSRLTEEFSVDPARCEADIRPFVERLVDRGLARVESP